MLLRKLCLTNDRFCICAYCETSAQCNELPLQSISNGFEIWPYLKELIELNEIKLVSLSPIQILGSIFKFFGGIRGAEGWPLFIKVNL